jgi:cell shape-determining protein MreC
MKMNFHQNHRTNRARALLIALIVIALLAGLQYWSVHPGSGLTHSALEPAWKARNAVAANVSAAFSLITSEDTVRSENRELRRRITELERSGPSRAALIERNRQLRAKLNRPATEASSVLAAVLVQPNVSPYDSLVIDVGTDQNVAAGDLVIAAGDIVVGRIANVYPSTATVQLLSSPGVETRARIDASVPVTAVGMGGGTFKGRVPRSVAVSEGDTVTIPGLNPNAFASVTSLQSEPTDPFDTVLFRSPVNIYEVSLVQVLTARPNVPLQTRSTQVATSTVSVPVSATGTATATRDSNGDPAVE